MIDASVQKRLGQFSLDASLSEEGFVCLSGKNGSGKTTFLEVLAGVLRTDGGFVRINGREVTNLPIARRGVVLVTPQSSIPGLEVEEHLRWGARLKGVKVSEERIASVRKELGIDFRGRVGKLSLGNRERVSLATALISMPEAIMVDEAFSNLHDREEFVSSYRELSSSAGIDVVFSTQNESDASLAQHLCLIAEGRTAKRF